MPNKRVLTTEHRFAAATFAASVMATAVSLAAVTLRHSLAFAAVAGLVASLALALGCSRVVLRRSRRILRSLRRVVDSFREGDFSPSLLVDREDEFGKLLRAHNDLGVALREQRALLAERELLLDSMVQNSPISLVLVDSYQRVVFANAAARQLLNDGRIFAGQDFRVLMSRAPAGLNSAIASGLDSLFAAQLDGSEETFHLAQRSFDVRGRRHHLYQIKRLTREISRQEVAIWKKLVRVISHELNNSLAPIASLAQSGQHVTRRESEPLAEIFQAIGERAEHLHRFIAGYASFAKLPTPKLELVDWKSFTKELSGQQPFRVVGDLPAVPGCFDRAQVAQAIINLLKNAHESGGQVEAVELCVTCGEGEQKLEVSDAGPGMSETVLAQALLPFYSTKRNGTGLGLALAREIAEAHGGTIRLSNRACGGFCAAIVLPLRVDRLGKGATGMAVNGPPAERYGGRVDP